MATDLILNVPEGTRIAELDPAIQEAVASVAGQYPPSGIMPGTVPYTARQLTQALANATLEDIEALIAGLALDWTVIAAQGDWITVTDPETGETTQQVEVYRPLDPQAVLPYLPPLVEAYDEQGNPTSSRAVTEQDLREGTVKLPIYAGHPDWQFT